MTEQTYTAEQLEYEIESWESLSDRKSDYSALIGMLLDLREIKQRAASITNADDAARLVRWINRDNPDAHWRSK